MSLRHSLLSRVQRVLQVSIPKGASLDEDWRSERSRAKNRWASTSSLRYSIGVKIIVIGEFMGILDEVTE